MDLSEARSVRGRKVAPLPSYLARKLNTRQVKLIQSEGGIGVHKNQEGQFRKIIAVLPSGDRNTPFKVVKYVVPKPSRPAMTQEQKEHQAFMEDLMEYEASGRHPNVKPTEADRAKKRVKSYVDHGRLVAGVHV